MRILINAVSRDTHPTGISRVAASHVKALTSLHPHVTVVLAIGEWQEALFSRLLGPHRATTVLCKGRNDSLNRNRWHAITLPRVATEHAVDVIHLSYPVPFFKRAVNVPVVLTLHDLYPYDIPENFGFPRYLVNRMFLRKCLAAVDGIASVSRVTLQRLEELVPHVARRVPSVVTGNYVETLTADGTPPSSLKLTPRGFILTVGQHRKNKNLQLLLRAFARIKHTHTSVERLVIVGAMATETARLREMTIEHGISHQVSFLHQINDRQLHWLYSNAACFVACSSIEGYCLPLAEALINETKVVCSDIPIFREIGRSHCVYFSLRGDPVSHLVDGLEQCLGSDHEERTNIGQHLFTPDQVLEKYLVLYRRVLPEKNTSQYVHASLG